MTPPEVEVTLALIRDRKRAELLRIIEEADGLSIKSGHLTIHFDGNGSIGSIEVHKRFSVR